MSPTRQLMHRLLALATATLACVASSSLSANEADSTTAVDANFYTSQIKPLFERKCYSCHGRLKQEAELRLETRELMLQGGDSGPALVPGETTSTLIWDRVTADEESRMPPLDEGTPLTEKELDSLKQWIVNGAPSPTESIPASPQQHWAFRPLDLSSHVQLSATTVNPIDRLLHRKHLDAGIRTQPREIDSLLIRRLYLDVTGLPPTLEQLDDTREWSVIVEELLSNPTHAERWARHWMDIWRYSDWYGLGQQLRYSQKHLWHWRDWIIESLEHDKGYDQMILEMLAADEIAPLDTQAIRGTGFLARNYYLFNRTTWLDSTIEHTGKAFLGLTLNCAKCHDHKYDPISQVDYYRFRAIFEPHQVRLDPVPLESNLDTNGLPRVFDDQPNIETYLHRRGDPKQPDTANPIAPGVPEFLSGFATPPQTVKLPLPAYAPAMRSEIIEARLVQAIQKTARSKQALQDAEAKLAKCDAESQTYSAAVDDVTLKRAQFRLAHCEATSLDAVYSAERARHEGKADFSEKAHRACIWQAELVVARAHLGRIQSPSDDEKKTAAAKETLHKAQAELTRIKSDPSEVEFKPLRFSRKALETPAHTFEQYPTTYSTTSTGRRTSLANWIISPTHPLTARVAVNHVWLRYFGTPLVESVDDFGLRAPEPEHLDLLNYLAREFIASGWSFRHLHRTILTSNAYQRASSPLRTSPVTLQVDPENRLYWRMNAKRMHSQVIRDSILALSGTLDLTRGGPSVDPDKPSQRRSIYFRHSRDDQNLFLSKFDDASHLLCYRRSETIVPQQALALANGRVSRANAGEIAKKISDELDEAEGDVEFSILAIRQLLGRPVAAKELSIIAKFRRQWYDEHTSGAEGELTRQEQRYRSWLIHTLLNHNDFITIR